MRQMEELFKLFNQKNYQPLLKCKLDYISNLYSSCRDSKDFTTIREIVENFSEIILLLENQKGSNNTIDNNIIEIDDEEPQFPNLDNLINSQPISDKDILDAFDDYMTKDCLFNRHKVPSDATIKDYIKRIKRYSREYDDGITIIELYNNIDSHINNYFNDNKNLDRNKKQHAAELSALKKLSNMKSHINHIKRIEQMRKNINDYIKSNLKEDYTNQTTDNKNYADLFSNKPLDSHFVTDEQRQKFAEIMKRKEVPFGEVLLKYVNRYMQEHPKECKTTTKLCEDVLHINREYYYKITKYNKEGISSNPTKKTVYTMAIGLGLSLDETKDLLDAAGYEISNKNNIDLGMEYCILEHLTYEDVIELAENENISLNYGFSNSRKDYKTRAKIRE